jgi:LPXTG-motif cell wall-anchored protein
LSYWVLTVAGVALILALASWMIRRRQGGRMVEPTAERIRNNFR